VVRAGAGVAHPGEESQGEFQAQNNMLSPMMSVPNVTMAKGGGANFGSGGSLGMTLEKSKLEFVMPTPTVQGPKLDDGGSGGDIGKNIHNGGGGDGDGGDDDDYFNEDDDGGDGQGDGQGDGFFRTVIPESYDKFSIAAVFAEWMKTVAELPLILRRAVEMGLFSSAQLVRFFSMDVRPNLTRSVSRNLPPTWARDFVGRLMADPAFVQKMVLESTFAAAVSLWYEYRARGDKFKQELDLALINTIGLAAATGATVWLLAPTRSYGSVHKFPWQQMLEGLPNCVFDASGPLRQYTNQARVGSFFAKMAELSAVGAVMGTTTSLLSTAAVAIHKKADPNFEPSVPVPSVGRSSGGMAAYFALNANIRYQLLGGIDRYLFDRSNFLWTYLGISGAARFASQQVGELSRPWWQGLPQPEQIRQQVRTKKVSKKVSKRVPKSSLRPAAAAEAVVVAPAGAVVMDVVSTSASGLQPLEASVSPLSVEQAEAQATEQGYESPAPGMLGSTGSSERYVVAQSLTDADLQASLGASLQHAGATALPVAPAGVAAGSA